MPETFAFVFSGEVRPPKKGEWFLDEPGRFLCAAFDHRNQHSIYHRVPYSVIAGLVQAVQVFLDGDVDGPRSLYFELEAAHAAAREVGLGKETTP